MKLVLEFEAEDLRAQDILNPVTELQIAAASGLGFSGELSDEATTLTPDGRELKISWRVEQ